MLNPLVSVYIPTHNRVDLLMERALPSVTNQTYRDLEIIVVAHGCTDQTENEVATYHFSHDWRVRCKSIPRVLTYPPTLETHWFAGRVAASNSGLEECTGDWIATIDDDDVWHPDLISSLLSFANEQAFDFVSAAASSPDGVLEPYDVDGVKVGSLQTWLYRSKLKSFKFNPDCWQNDHNRVCDTDLQQQFRDAGVKMGFLDRVLCDILPRPGDSEIGSRAAKADEQKYLDHLAF